MSDKKVWLVTGAGRGIGAAAAKTYAAHGATVLLLGKTEANLTQVYDEIEAAIASTYGGASRVPSFLRFGSWVGGDRDGNDTRVLIELPR